MNLLAFSTVLDDTSAGDRRIEQIAEAGFDGVEPTLANEGARPSLASPVDSAEHVRRVAERCGIRAPSMRGGPAFWPSFGAKDADKRRKAVDAAEAGLDAVEALGGDTLLIVPGLWEGDQTYAEFRTHALDTARRIAELAEAKRIRVGLENVQNRFLLSPSEWIAFLDEVGSDWVKMYFDVGNTWWLRRGFPEQWIHELGPDRIGRIHFKDAVEGGDVVHLLEGGVNWPAVARAIGGIGYDDWIAVELDVPAHLPEAMLRATASSARAILDAGP